MKEPSEPARIERDAETFASPAEADKASFEYYRSLTSEQRLAVALEHVPG